MRKCPICDDTFLSTVKFHGQSVDRCAVCEGIYFDKGELESIVHLVKLFRDSRLDEREIDTISEQEKKRIICCPVDNFRMHKKDIMGEVIDICPSCEGIWLDNGEILALKSAENHIKQNLSLYVKLGH